MNVGELRALRRRYHALLALRFFPTGLTITVFVLLLRDRGFTLAEIGVGTAAQGVVMLFLELPSGGLADALGRKPVLAVAGAFSVVATAVLLFADTMFLLAVAAGLLGVFRALDSGPLQSWFIDAAQRVDADVPIERDIARADVVICASIGAGALLASAIVRADGILGLAPLVAPVVLAIAVQTVGVVAVVVLLDDPRAARGWSAARRSIVAVPTVVAEAVTVVRASSVLTALVVAELLWGFGTVALETLLPSRLAEVSGGVDNAAGLLGPAVSAAWMLSAMGAVVAPYLVRRFGARWSGFGLRLVHGGAVAGMGLAVGPTGVVVAYLATYWVHGASAPVHYGTVHRAVESTHRVTVISANSLASQLGFAAGGVTLGALADGTSITTAMLVAALVLAAAAPLYLAGRGVPRAGSSRTRPAICERLVR